jgi:hypothetical protein
MGEQAVRFKAKCKCGTEIKADQRKLFGLSIRVHEASTGHQVKIKEV